MLCPDDPTLLSSRGKLSKLASQNNGQESGHLSQLQRLKNDRNEADEGQEITFEQSDVVQ